MAIGDWNAGIIRPNAVAPTGPYEDGAAPGVWTLDQVAYWNKQGLWPTAGRAATGFFMSSNKINKISIQSTGNSTDFGTGVTSNYNCGCASSTRMLMATDTITYVEFATGGAQSNFGTLSAVYTREVAGLSSATRGLFAGGNRNFSPSNIIDYVTIASTGNATDFGDLTVVTRGAGAASSPTRGVVGGGFQSSAINVISYVTIASTGNATDFGDLTLQEVYGGGCSSATRAVWAGGEDSGGSSTNVIGYITIATTGNATDFGDLTQGRREGPAACSSPFRGVFAGGYTSSNVNTIDYVTLATTGNATDFGDLLSASSAATGGSNAHGGL